MEEGSKLWYFQNFNIMDALSEEEKMEVSKMASMNNSGKKEVVYFPEDSSNKIYFLKSGKVKLSKYSPDGKEMIMAILGPGEIFGELSVISQGKRAESAEVMEDAIICSLRIEDLQSMLQKNPNFNFSITKLIGLKLTKIQSRLESLVFKNTNERVKGFIKEMADEHGRTLINGTEIEVKLKLTHEDIAKLTATTRQSVTTILSQLEKDGVILYDRKRILIKKYDQL